MSKLATLNNNNAALLVAMILTDSFHFIFAKAMVPYVEPIVGGFYVMLISTLQLFIFAVLTKQLKISTFLKYWRPLSLVGLLIGTSIIITYTSVHYIDAGTATLLAQISPIFGLGLGVIWLKEHISQMQLRGAILALMGVAAITFQPGEYLQLGALMVLIASLTYTLHAAVVKRYCSSIPFIEFFFWRLFATTFVLFILITGQNQLVLPQMNAWPILIATATVDVVISRTLYYVALRKIDISIHSILLTVSPVAAIFWSGIFFGSQPTFMELVGGVAVLSGAFIVTRYKSKRPVVQEATCPTNG